MRNPLLHNLLIDRRCVSSADGRSRPVRRKRSSLAHPSPHKCSLRSYRSIATPNGWIPATKSMKQNPEGSPTAAHDCLRGGYGSFRFCQRTARRAVPVVVSEWLGATPRDAICPSPSRLFAEGGRRSAADPFVIAL